MAEKFAKYNRKSITESDWKAADILEVGYIVHYSTKRKLLRN